MPHTDTHDTVRRAEHRVQASWEAATGSPVLNHLALLTTSQGRWATPHPNPQNAKLLSKYINGRAALLENPLW